MKLFVEKSIEQYAFDHTAAEPQYLQELADLTHAEVAMPQMLTGRTEGRLLKLLVAISRPKLILEIGTFTGYSALSMAEGLSQDGRIISCEIDTTAQQVAQNAIDKSPYREKIEIRMGPALETLRSIDEPIDFSFVDADKESYGDYYEELVTRMRPGGIIVLDNMFWSGEVLKPESEAAHTLARLNKTICNDDRVDNVLLTVRDGVQLVRKK